MNFDVITVSLKKAADVLMANIVAYLVGAIIAGFGSLLLVTSAPFMYGLCYMVLKGTRGETVEINDVFYGFSGGRFIRSWIGVLGTALPFIVISLVVGILFLLLTVVLKGVGAALGVLLLILAFILCFVLAIFVCYAFYIFVMTPSGKIVDALKESIRISKANLVMTIITLIVAGICGIIPFVGGVLGQIFFVYMFKEIEPSIRDQS